MYAKAVHICIHMCTNMVFTGYLQIQIILPCQLDKKLIDKTDSEVKNALVLQFAE